MFKRKFFSLTIDVHSSISVAMVVYKTGVSIVFKSTSILPPGIEFTAVDVQNEVKCLLFIAFHFECLIRQSVSATAQPFKLARTPVSIKGTGKDSL